MTTSTNQQAGWMDYETMLKLQQMDPGRAEAYKTEQRKKYQLNRISGAIDSLKEEYVENLGKDPENKNLYVDRLRRGIIEIPGIEGYVEFSEIFQSAKDQLENLDGTSEDVSSIVTSPSDDYDQPGMDELSSDEPDLQEVAMETEERSAIDEKINGTSEDEASLPAESEIPNPEFAEEKESNISDYHAKYLEKFNKEVPNNKKNDVEWIAEKLEKVIE